MKKLKMNLLTLRKPNLPRNRKPLLLPRGHPEHLAKRHRKSHLPLKREMLRVQPSKIKKIRSIPRKRRRKGLLLTITRRKRLQLKPLRKPR
jgi:hypothetical protein